MHLLIATLGSAGDVHPFLAIGGTAQARGHRVTVCTNPAFQAAVEACGLRFRPIGTAESFAAAMADPALWQPRTSLRTLWQVIAATLAEQYETLRAEAGGDAVMLGSLWAFGARLLHETTGVPYLSAHVSPSTILSAEAPPVHAGFRIPAGLPLPARRLLLRAIESWAIDPLMTPSLDAVRGTLGLKPARRVMTRWIHAPQGVLALYPRWFAAIPADGPGACRQVGFPLFDPAPGVGLDAELLAFLAAGPQPVVITAGSTGLDGGDFFARTLQAVRACGRRAVLLGDLGGAPPDLAADAIHRRFVPLAALLARSAALLHHGGIGTAAFALAAGLPQLVTPFAHDQFDNAERLVALGGAVRGDPAAPAEVLAAMLARLLDDPAIGARCRAVRLQAAADCGSAACSAAVDALEAAGARERLAA
jgi:rhamnosyltransferase subunit B